MIAIFYPLSSILNISIRLFQQPALVHLVTQVLGDFSGDPRVSHFFEGNFLAGELAQHL